MKWRSLDESASAVDVRPLREILLERQTQLTKYVLPETQSVHVRVVQQLREERIADRALKVGAHAPEFRLLDHRGEAISSGDLLSHGPLVVVFFRGRWCPFCVAQVEAVNFILPAIKSGGASLVAISPQSVKQSFFMVDQHKLGFPLLSDSGNKIATGFGLTYSVPEEQRAIYKRAFVNLPFVNEDASWTLPIPATFVLDRQGIITYMSANEDYTQRPEPPDILRALPTF
jgi:peroxiredoxin